MAQVKEKTFMVKLATFIVDKRNLFFLLTVIGLIFSVFSRNWVKVENDLTYYLPEDAETKLALNLMEEQFTTYGTAEVMVANLTYSQAEALRDTLADNGFAVHFQDGHGLHDWEYWNRCIEDFLKNIQKMRTHG